MRNIKLQELMLLLRLECFIFRSWTVAVFGNFSIIQFWRTGKLIISRNSIILLMQRRHSTSYLLSFIWKSADWDKLWHNIEVAVIDMKYLGKVKKFLWPVDIWGVEAELHGLSLRSIDMVVNGHQAPVDLSRGNLAGTHRVGPHNRSTIWRKAECCPCFCRN